MRPLDDAIHLNRGLAALSVEKTMEKVKYLRHIPHCRAAQHYSASISLPILCSEMDVETSEFISLAELQAACLSSSLYEVRRLLVSWWSRPGFQTKGKVGGAKPRSSGTRNGGKTDKIVLEAVQQ